ncbi:MAG: hypothetical protein GX146_09550 [Myxococcales bacterium]|jgi:hypothetical protein|nr:hypothetical protein [Myxococcales bacterium]
MIAPASLRRIALLRRAVVLRLAGLWLAGLCAGCAAGWSSAPAVTPETPVEAASETPQTRPVLDAPRDNGDAPYLDDEECVVADAADILERESLPDVAEGRAELGRLIQRLTRDPQAPDSAAPQELPAHAEPAQPASPIAVPSDAQASFSAVVVPDATAIAQLSRAQCFDILKRARIATEPVNEDAPFVEMPLRLTSPVEGVRIAPKWTPKGQTRHDIMDCRLVVALIPLAREAKMRGAEDIRFFSTYRPLTRPESTCAKGAAGKTCRQQQERWKKAEAGKLSQHHRAIAIDIHGFTMADGRYISVLDHYERRDGSPPCQDKPKTPEGIFLKELACALHAARAFHVMLTPNANKAHHNHFHFDITPKANWFIIR